MALTLRVQRKTKRKLKPLSALAGPRTVKVGFPASKSSKSNIEKAVWNEFGTRGGASGGGWGGPIPERPFMRNSVRDNRLKYRNALRVSASKLVLGETSLTIVLSKLGILASDDIRMEIDALKSPPNSPVTIERKGSSNPLIDTGAMRQAVTWAIENG
ncbi:tail completion or Neck1 protein [Rhizobium phage RHEph06]|uniref:Uncharacterized protein n=4 Tax=Kleczkowskavirus RHEph4 TaxID=1921526 RepID=L7TME2_9CAUD|nr:tail completion or Neck1 protein [Rhizobium phage RHEph06]YP_009598463.1 tail completion or Neck1 protein [Rhizobium phage RHEph04]AGC35783.1 hypothetical protein RHEph05_gp016 [Rhizobium phage RHEph05]QIG67646.1 putative morphogenesis protein [Rhizobium phage RHph_Y17]QIG68965.1 putative morphogenesis protein [Rhizobium phage RHph_Y3_43]QIG69514.1 putative morphogenesis protein [Rhizobium phage RHph_I36]QIG75388.1 putative morphogenesis protein [Rhizobium phage RHph_Y1_1]QIG75938.1 putat